MVINKYLILFKVFTFSFFLISFTFVYAAPSQNPPAGGVFEVNQSAPKPSLRINSGGDIDLGAWKATAVGISYGGTGATQTGDTNCPGTSCVTGARTNIGAATAGANSDITSLSPTGNLILTPTGNVSIGTTSTAGKLTVSTLSGGTTSTLINLDGQANAPDFNLRLGSDGTHNGSSVSLLIFGRGTGTEDIRYEVGNWGGYYTWGLGSQAGQKVLMGLTSSGSGSTGASHHGVLNLYSATDAQINYSSGAGAGTVNVRLSASGNSWLNGGNVGIGTMTPQAKLEIASSGGTDIQIIQSGSPVFKISEGSQPKVTVGAGTIIFDNAGTGGINILGAKPFVLQTNSGQEALRVIQNGNVGIGTILPETKLDIEGNLRIGSGYIDMNRNNSTSTGISWYNTPGGYTAWQDYMAPAGINQGVTGTVTAPSGSLVTSWSKRSFIENAGGYGWTFESGTSSSTTPSVKFEIASSDGSFRSAGNGTIVGNLTVSTPTAASHAATKSYVDSASGGGVSSGTGNQTLRHNGTSWVGSSLLVNDGTNVGIGSIVSGIKLNVDGKTRITDMALFGAPLAGLDDYQNSPISIRERGFAGSGDGLDKNAPNLNFHWSGRVSNSFWMDTAGRMHYGSYDGIGNPTSSGTFITGNVGIGDTTPDAKLDVEGEVRIGSGNYLTFGNDDATSKDFGLRAEGENLFIREVEEANKFYGGFYDDSRVSFGVGAEVLTATTANVGVGNSGPSYKLDVSGTGRFTQPVIVGTPTANDHATTKSYVDSSISAGTASALWTGDNRTISPSEYGHNKMLFGFTSYNNNNTSPYADFMQLNSYNDSSGGSDNLLVFNRSGFGARMYQQAWNSITAFTSYKDFVLADNSPTANYVPKYTGTGDTVSIANSSIYDNGNVGIGTSGPAKNLHIRNVADAAILLEADVTPGAEDNNAYIKYIQDGGGVGGFTGLVGNLGRDPENNLYTGTIDNSFLVANTWASSSSAVQLGANGAVRMTILGSGNVGIGNSGPSYKLDVSGTGRFTSTVVVGTPTDASHATTKAYVDSASGGGVGAGTSGQTLRHSGTGWVASGALTNNGSNINIASRLEVGGNSLLYMPSNNPERGPWNPIWNAIGSSRSLFSDEEFSSGNNNIGVYNNAGGSAVTVTRQTGQLGVPNSTGVWLKVSYDGVGSVSPNFGGVVQSFVPSANRTYVQRFRAKIPSGRILNIHENSQGSNATSYWLTNNVGTNKWEDYIRVSHAGNTGTFSSGGHIAISGGSGAFDWYIASMNVYEVNTPLIATSNSWKASQGFDAGASFPGSGVWNTSGNVGINDSTPSFRLDVNGTARFIGTVVVATPTDGSHAATKSYVDSTVGGGTSANSNSCSADLVCEMQGANLNGGDITGINKITVQTIDPIYEINDKKYATYVSDTIGLKMEYYGKADLLKRGDYYQYDIDFKNADEGSDFWLFWQTIDEGMNMKDIIVSLTPEGGWAKLWYEVDSKNKRIIISADRKLSVSYHLVAPRHDAKKWPTLMGETKERGAVLEEKK